MALISAYSFAPVTAASPSSAGVIASSSSSSSSSAATLYTIDDAHVHPAASWREMGSPEKLNATQLAALMAASQIRVQRGVPVTRLNASCVELQLLMVPNSVAVAAF